MTVEIVVQQVSAAHSGSFTVEGPGPFRKGDRHNCDILQGPCF